MTSILLILIEKNNTLEYTNFFLPKNMKYIRVMNANVKCEWGSVSLRYITVY